MWSSNWKVGLPYHPNVPHNRNVLKGANSQNSVHFTDSAESKIVGVTWGVAVLRRFANICEVSA